MKKSTYIPFFKNREKHPFHIVDRSLLPIWVSQSVFMLILAILNYFHPNFITNMPNAWVLYSCSFFFFTLSLLSWFIQVVIESGQGHHTKAVRQGLRLGMIFFIISEIMFFFAFFWAFFHLSLSPSIAIGAVWPPKGIQPLDIWGLPLVNTLLLLSSGVTITLAHRSILKANCLTEHYNFQAHLAATIILGITFLCCQWIEYKYGLTFTWKENAYGSTFFVTTGFHGLHVIIGTLFLLFCLIRSLLTLIPLYTKQDFINFFRPTSTERYIANHDLGRTLINQTLQVKSKNTFIIVSMWLFRDLYLAAHGISYLWAVLPKFSMKYSSDRATREYFDLKEKFRADKTSANLIIMHLKAPEHFLNSWAWELEQILRKFFESPIRIAIAWLKPKIESGLKSILAIIEPRVWPIYTWMATAWPQYGFTKHQHLGFEAAAWYWHFVDVVWLFLFISIYWWGS